MPRRDRHRGKRMPRHQYAPGNDPLEEQTLPPDTVISISPEGREMLNQVLKYLSDQVGQPVTAQDILRASKIMRTRHGFRDDVMRDPVLRAEYFELLKEPPEE